MPYIFESENNLNHDKILEIWAERFAESVFANRIEQLSSHGWILVQQGQTDDGRCAATLVETKQNLSLTAWRACLN